MARRGSGGRSRPEAQAVKAAAAESFVIAGLAPGSPVGLNLPGIYLRPQSILLFSLSLVRTLARCQAPAVSCVASALSTSIAIGRHGRVSPSDPGQELLASPIISVAGPPVRGSFLASRKNSQCPEDANSHGFAPTNPSFQFAHGESNPSDFPTAVRRNSPLVLSQFLRSDPKPLIQW